MFSFLWPALPNFMSIHKVIWIHPDCSQRKILQTLKKSFVFIFFRNNGTCTQCVAFLFSLTSFWERHRDRGTEVGTDTQCVWNKPRIRNPTPRRSSTRGWTRHKTDPQPTAVTCTKDSFNPILPAQGPQPYLEKELYELVEILMFLFCRLLKVMMVPWWWLCDTANYGRCLQN